MRIEKKDVPVRVEAPGAIGRMQTDFGDMTGYSTMSAEHFSLGAGTDIAPLLQGLKDDLCQAPHWGYLADGALTVTYKDGSTEEVKGGDMFYWPPGHTVRVAKDAELIMFSPQHEHLATINHMKKKLGGG